MDEKVVVLTESKVGGAIIVDSEWDLVRPWVMQSWSVAKRDFANRFRGTWHFLFAHAFDSSSSTKPRGEFDYLLVGGPSVRATAREKNKALFCVTRQASSSKNKMIT